LFIIGDSSQAFSPFRAEVAELADAQASGACGRKVVEVQILSSAPDFARLTASDVQANHRYLTALGNAALATGLTV
jgi:hypothetical protein